MRFSIDTLGCKVNTYESNVIIDLFESHGYEQVKENADVAIINTCTVTNTADRKSVKMIHQAVRRNPDAIVVVVGCLTQVKSDMVRRIDGVDIVLGNIGKSKNNLIYSAVIVRHNNYLHSSILSIYHYTIDLIL